MNNLQMLLCNRRAWRIHFQFNNEKSTYMKESNKERKQIKIIKAKSDTKEQQKYHELNLFSLELGVHFYITLLNTYKHL